MTALAAAALRLAQMVEPAGLVPGAGPRWESPSADEGPAVVAYVREGGSSRKLHDLLMRLSPGGGTAW